MTSFEKTSYEIKSLLSEEELYALPDSDTYQNWATLVELARRECTAVDAFPNLVYTDEESDARTTLLTDIKMYIEQAFGQFITGEIDIDADWDTYIGTLEQMGMKKLIEIEQAAYDRAYK